MLYTISAAEKVTTYRCDLYVDFISERGSNNEPQAIDTLKM